MARSQQDEAFDQFNQGVEDWLSRATGKMKKVNVVKQRNDAVLAVAKSLTQKAKTLDLGCGTGDLAIALAQMGLDSIGIDFAPEMIKAANKRQKETKLNTATFICGSILDLNYEPHSFDLISGVGLLEYFTPTEGEKLIGDCQRLLRPGGRLVLGSRNRLFNIFSLNSFTQIELELGTTVALLREAEQITTVGDFEVLLSKALNEKVELPHPKSHPKTSVSVSTRYQYTPFQMIQIFSRAGLKVKNLFPVHYHPLAAPVKDDFMDLHIQTSNMLNEQAQNDHRLIPKGSTFVIDGEKSL